MGRRSKRALASIQQLENLYGRPFKRQKTNENKDLASVALKQSKIAQEHLPQVFAEITQPASNLFCSGPCPEVIPMIEDTQITEDVPMDTSETITPIPIDKPSSRAQFQGPPELKTVLTALANVTAILRPKKPNNHGYRPFKGDELLRKRLCLMQMFFRVYIKQNKGSSHPRGWIAASKRVTELHGVGPETAKHLRSWARHFIKNCDDLPYNRYGTWSTSLLDSGDLAQGIHEHLLSLGRFVHGLDIVHFVNSPEIQAKYSLPRKISLSTAIRWMSKMNYRWKKLPNGLYKDGHSRKDVVDYRQNVYLPRLAELQYSTRRWKQSGNEDLTNEIHPQTRRVVVWYQDEVIFYANDRRSVTWVHPDHQAVPMPKGEGQSIMIVDFVSADYGWLRNIAGNEEARKLFKPGKNRDGYFSNDDIIRFTKNIIKCPS